MLQCQILQVVYLNDANFLTTDMISNQILCLNGYYLTITYRVCQAVRPWDVDSK